MSKHLRGPFLELQGISPLDFDSPASDAGQPLNAAEEAILDRMALVNDALAANDCNCNGHALGAQRDPFFGSDISELVLRSEPHLIYGMNDDGTPWEATVQVKLETLTAEVDDNGEVMAWIYEES